MDLGVQSLRDRIREWVGDVVEDIVEMTPDDPGEMDYWLEPRADRPRPPALEEGPAPPGSSGSPRARGRLPSSPRRGPFECALAEPAKLASRRCREVRARNARLEAQRLGSGEPVIALLPEHAVLAPPDLIHRLDHVAHHVEPVEDDLEVPVRHVVQ